MLRFAFPHKIYAERENTQVNATNTSDNFRSVMNPRDMWSDTVKNFSKEDHQNEPYNCKLRAGSDTLSKKSRKF